MADRQDKCPVYSVPDNVLEAAVVGIFAAAWNICCMDGCCMGWMLHGMDVAWNICCMDGCCMGWMLHWMDAAWDRCCMGWMLHGIDAAWDA